MYCGLHQNETGGDGICDASYIIDVNNTDRYSLMRPYMPLLGDLNYDRTVDVLDAMKAASAFGSYPEHPRWNSAADLNQDDVKV